MRTCAYFVGRIDAVFWECKKLSHQIDLCGASQLGGVRIAMPLSRGMLVGLDEDCAGEEVLGSDFSVACPSDVAQLLSQGAVVAVGVSGGKDSCAVAMRLHRYLDAIGFSGPRVLIHSDLGRIEWEQSLPVCQRLADQLGWELMVERREAGDMIARWYRRWENNVQRYEQLDCVKVILPWSTPSMRFCTSELKTSVITSALRRRFPDAPILSVTGVRAEESASRSKMPVLSPQPKLTRRGVHGWNWNPILHWRTTDVFRYLDCRNVELHEAYSTYGCTRVSCSFCIMSSGHDLVAASTAIQNQDAYTLLVELEAKSGFAFQGNRWLADVAPSLLSPGLAHDVERAKAMALARGTAECRLPAHLLYTSGWPTVLPSLDEARLIGEVRAEVARVQGFSPSFTSPLDVQARYEELITLKAAKDEKQGRAGATKRARVTEPLGVEEDAIA